ELVETAYAAIVDPGVAKPEALGSEKVGTDGSIRLATGGEVIQLAGLTPDPHSEVAGLLLRAEAIGEAELADVEVVAVEARAGKARLMPDGEVAVVKAVVQINRLRRREGRGDPGRRVVVARDHSEHRRIDEDRRVDQARDGRDGRRGVADGHRSHDVV